MKRVIANLSPYIFSLGVGSLMTYYDIWLPLAWVLTGIGIIGILWKLDIRTRVCQLKLKWSRVKQNTKEKIARYRIKPSQDSFTLYVEFIDLHRREHLGEEAIVVRFQINNNLSYPFQPARMWITPELGGYEPQEPQREIIPAPNLLSGNPSQMDSKIISIKDGRLRELVIRDREGKKVAKILRVDIQPYLGAPLIILKGEAQQDL